MNRRQRRTRQTRRPQAGDSPKQQMRDFLKQPGKFHIVELPDEKSFVVKVTEREMPLFLTICGQLKGVLGYCEVTPATPVDASIADAGTIARQTSGDPYRLKVAQERQDAAEAEFNGSNPTPFENPELDAALARHPAGKRRPAGGRHAKQEPDTVFDQLARGAATDDSEAQARLASIELAAAQDAAAKAQEAADTANAHLAEVYERTGEIHNRRVLDGFTDAAGEAIAEKADAWTGDGPYIEARAEDAKPSWPQWDITTGRPTVPDESPVQHDFVIGCSLNPECNWKASSSDLGTLLRAYGQHAIDDHGHDT